MRRQQLGSWRNLPADDDRARHHRIGLQRYRPSSRLRPGARNPTHAPVPSREFRALSDHAHLHGPRVRYQCRPPLDREVTQEARFDSWDQFLVSQNLPCATQYQCVTPSREFTGNQTQRLAETDADSLALSTGGTGDAAHRPWVDLQTSRRDLPTTAVAYPIGPVVQLGQGSIHLG